MVKQKSGLNRVILNQEWGMFKEVLKYKQGWLGGQVIFVDPKHTSQTYPACGHQSKDNRLTQSKFECVKCDYQNNADHVGALNSLARGHRVLACGEIDISQLVEAGTCLVSNHKAPMVLNQSGSPSFPERVQALSEVEEDVNLYKTPACNQLSLVQCLR